MSVMDDIQDAISSKVADWTVKTVDAFFIHSQKPKVGSVLYCNLALAFEHTGIYVGGGKVVHLNGDGVVEKVSLKKFMNRLDGINPSCSIFCATDSDGKSISDIEVAERALEMVGHHQSYNLFLENCHCFTHYCLTGTKAPFGSFSKVEELLRAKFGLASWRAINMS